jgi:hypothetical protein
MTQLLDNVGATTSYTGQAIITDWTTSYTSVAGSSVMFNYSFSAWTNSGGASRKFDLLVDSVVVASSTFYFNQNSVHTTIPCLFNVENLSAGSHTIQLRIPTGTIVDSGDFAHLTVIETASGGSSGTSGSSGSSGSSGTSGSSGSSGTSGIGIINFASGMVNAGTFVTLDNLKATVTTSGNRGLALSTTVGTISSYIGGYTTYNSGSFTYNTTSGASPYSITTSTGNSSIFNWNFTNASDTAIYHVNDLTNNRFYRITMMIGPGYNNNMISIERLV